MTAPLLTIEAATKTFVTGRADVVALARIDMHVNEGEFICLVGASGCGKSTLLNLIAGLDYPTSGRLVLDGHEITGPGGDRGMVFQRDCLFPWLTVRDNVRFGLRLKANAPIAEAYQSALERADHLIEAVGLTNFADAYPKELSGGMRQRAAIARALVTRPRLLLMDEPFGALDACTRESMQNLLLDLCIEQRTTVVFVTHDVEEAVFLADRVLVMRPHPGQIIADVAVNLPRARSQDLKLGSVFNRLRGVVSGMIRQPREAVSVRAA